MKRNGIAHHLDSKRHGRKTIEGNGLMARGGKRSGRVGRAKGGRAKR